MAAEIVVGIDESPSGRAALRWAAAYARSAGARLRAIHVLAWPETRDAFAGPVVYDYLYPDADQLDDSLTVGNRRLFEQVGPEPSWTLQFGQGHPGQVLVDESRGADLLVVGTREHRGVGRLLFGSVGHYCINRATCPVVAVPAEPPTGHDAPTPVLQEAR